MARHGKNYRGSGRSKIGVAIPVLIVLCIIAGATLYFLSDDESYTKNGDKVVSVENDKKEEQKAPEVTDIVIEQTGGEKITEETPKTETPPAEVKAETRSCFVKLSDIKNAENFDRELASAKAQGNINTLVLEVKDESGAFVFAYDHEFLNKKQLDGNDEVLKSAVAKAKEQGFSVAFYLSCFKDNGAAHSNFKNAVIQKGKGWVWRDASDIRWLSIYSETSCEYITGMIEKLVSFSPDEIILANISFPAVGNTGSIDYGETAVSKRDAISAFIDKAKAASGNVELSAVYENYDAKRISASGQDISVFKRGFARLYIERDGGKNTLSFDTARTAVADADYKLIPVAPSFDAETTEFMIKK